MGRWSTLTTVHRIQCTTIAQGSIGNSVMIVKEVNPYLTAVLYPHLQLLCLKSESHTSRRYSLPYHWLLLFYSQIVEGPLRRPFARQSPGFQPIIEAGRPLLRPNTLSSRGCSDEEFMSIQWPCFPPLWQPYPPLRAGLAGGFARGQQYPSRINLLHFHWLY